MNIKEMCVNPQHVRKAMKIKHLYHFANKNYFCNPH